MKPLFYMLIALITVLIVFKQTQSGSHKSDFNIQGFSDLPVQVGGRIKPMDSVARNTLLILSGRQYTITPSGEKITPIHWFNASSDLNR